MFSTEDTKYIWSNFVFLIANTLLVPVADAIYIE